MISIKATTTIIGVVTLEPLPKWSRCVERSLGGKWLGLGLLWVLIGSLGLWSRANELPNGKVNPARDFPDRVLQSLLHECGGRFRDPINYGTHNWNCHE